MGCCSGKVVEESEDDLRRKIILVGDSNVGKSCLFRRYKTGEFDEFTPQSVIPSSLDTHAVETDYKGKKIVTVICDTGGQETFKHLRKTNYPNSDVIIVCFSLDDEKTFENSCKFWVPEMRDLCRGVPMILTGNKRDLRDDAQTLNGFIRESQGNQAAQKNKMLTYIETSSVTGANVDRVFSLALETAAKRTKKLRKRNFDEL